MTEWILLIGFLLALGSFFLANLWSYKSDKELIKEYFEANGKKVSNIKNSSENKFQDKQKLKEIKVKNRIKNSITISKSGSLLRNSFYSVTTLNGEKFELLVTNSLFFFVKPKLYLDE